MSSTNPTMEALMKWSVQNTDSNAPAASSIAQDIKAGKRPDLDPAVLDSMMGKSEGQMMKEQLAAALNEEGSEDDRETALDNFEMLIESIDNANMITSMKLWSALLSLLASPSPRLQLATLWILGTAVQNNPSAQDALLHSTGSQGGESSLDSILALLRDSPDMGIRAKGLYALSAILGHHPRAVRDFEGRGGYEVLKGALRDPSITIRRKAAFLVNTLLLQDDSVEQAVASRPLMIGGPSNTSSGGAATTTASAAPVSSTLSRATGLAPAPGSSEPVSAPTPPHNPAPLEKPPVTSTKASGIVHPSIPAALLSSGLLHVLLSSILPLEVVPSSLKDSVPPELGLDGESTAREDEDYSEKALRAILSFTAKLKKETEANLLQRAGSTSKLDAASKEGLLQIKEELAEGGEGHRLWDWKTLSVDREDWEKFVEAVERL